jgi:hypothetical protein
MRTRCVHNTNIQVFWDINALSTGKVAGVLDGCNALGFSVKHFKSSSLGLPDMKTNTVRNVDNYVPIATVYYPRKLDSLST